MRIIIVHIIDCNIVYLHLILFQKRFTWIYVTLRKTDSQLHSDSTVLKFMVWAWLYHSEWVSGNEWSVPEWRPYAKDSSHLYSEIKTRKVREKKPCNIHQPFLGSCVLTVMLTSAPLLTSSSRHRAPSQETADRWSAVQPRVFEWLTLAPQLTSWLAITSSPA